MHNTFPPGRVSQAASFATFDVFSAALAMSRASLAFCSRSFALASRLTYFCFASRALPSRTSCDSIILGATVGVGAAIGFGTSKDALGTLGGGEKSTFGAAGITALGAAGASSVEEAGISNLGTLNDGNFTSGILISGPLNSGNLISGVSNFTSGTAGGGGLGELITSSFLTVSVAAFSAASLFFLAISSIIFFWASTRAALASSFSFNFAAFSSSAFFAAIFSSSAAFFATAFSSSAAFFAAAAASSSCSLEVEGGASVLVLLITGLFVASVYDGREKSRVSNDDDPDDAPPGAPKAETTKEDDSMLSFCVIGLVAKSCL
mmetsp:Transcript_27186/g.33591  ORF Transcript_27186/g.33591 Transcript_27186/m.33591 type:complete len:321 (+) Transcript_27186:582-1544(+)